MCGVECFDETRGAPAARLALIDSIRPQLEVAEIEAIAERVKDTAAQLRPFEPGFADRNIDASALA
jgi:hypothetical protein